MTQERKNRMPAPGEVWRYKPRHGHGFVVQHPTETRHVVDSTLGGSVVYVSGRYSRHANLETCTLADWAEWSTRKETKRIDNLESAKP